MLKVHAGTTLIFIHANTNVVNIYPSALPLRDSITGGLSVGLNAAGVVMSGACGLRTRCAPPLHWKCASPGNKASLRTNSGRTGGDNVVMLRAIASSYPLGEHCVQSGCAVNHTVSDACART